MIDSEQQDVAMLPNRGGGGLQLAKSIPMFSGPTVALRAQSFDAGLRQNFWGRYSQCACGGEGKMRAWYAEVRSTGKAVNLVHGLTPSLGMQVYVPEAEQEARRPHASSLTAIQLEEEEAAKRKAIQQEEEAAHKRAALEKAAQRKASRQEKAQRKASARAAGAGAAEGGSSSQRHQSCGTPPAGEAAQRSQQGAGSTEGGSGAGGGGGEHVGKGKQGDS
eukprot:1140071-Pelagomonas_calceolata.AAC.5